MDEKSSLLGGKTIYFLGSSVTRGHGGDTDGYSFAEGLEKSALCRCVKNAVSGTTLVCLFEGDDSYVSRLKRFDFSREPYALVVQLSTNDFARGIAFEKITRALGEIAATVRVLSPKTKLVLYTCPLQDRVAFYSEYERYLQTQLKSLALPNGPFSVLDLFSHYRHDGGDYLQADGLHPTRAGYDEFFVPALRETLERL